MNPLITFIPLIATLQFPAQPASPEITAELLANQQSIQPGGSAELAIKITVPEDWKAYHPIILDTGAATLISFEVSPGFTIDDLRFPIPNYAEEADLAYLALEGEFIILTILTADADVPATPATITATIDAFICKVECIPVQTTATLNLPVSGDTPQPTNKELFDEARANLPPPLADAPFINGSAIAISEDTLAIDEEAEITLTVKVQTGHHVQDRDPGNKDLIPSRLFIERPDGIKLGDQKWPEAHVKFMQYFGKVREQSGTFKIRVPITIIDNKFPAGPVTLRALFSYQCCTDAGTCFPPETAEATITFNADTPNPALPPTVSRSAYTPVVATTGTPTTTGQPAAAPPAPAGLLFQLLAGFLGGLILNIMPCVFPVISIKILGFVKQAGEDRQRVFNLGLAFCAGIMVWFWFFALLTGWGELPWQHPPVVIGLTAVLFVFALNLFGVFEITLPGAATDKLGEAAGREGYVGSFMKGLLATLLGTACTAPFFAGAAAYAATQPLWVAWLIFSAAGLGMSSPYLLLSGFPGWLQYLPKPGAWMVIFKQAMGFILIGTAVWLLLIVADLTDARGVVWTIAFLSFLAVSVWLIGKIQLNWSTSSRLVTWTAATALGLLGLWFSFFFMYDLSNPQPAVAYPGNVAANGRVDPKAIAAAIVADVRADDWNDHIPWQPWLPGLPEELARQGYTVFVDFTATWCVTCQTNKAAAIDVESTRELMKEMGVIPLKADYTKRDTAIRDVLLKWGNNSVPMNLIYPANRPDDAIKLPLALLTPDAVKTPLTEAGPSTE
jgi:thiol:disulfide interchange protein DsbD